MSHASHRSTRAQTLKLRLGDACDLPVHLVPSPPKRLSVDVSEDAVLVEPGWEELKATVRKAKQDAWLIDPADITTSDVLGRGCSGVVHRGQWRGNEVAVKNVSINTPLDAKSFLREVKMLSGLRHPNILPFHGAVIRPPGHCLVITKCMKGGTLWNWLHKSDRKPCLTKRLIAALQVAKGMKYLEEGAVPTIHRDLKLSNIFMDVKDGNAIIADFGLARWTPETTEDALTGETGTYVYMAPEVILHQRYTGSADVYSFGVVLNELVTGEQPYVGMYLTPVQCAHGVSTGKLRPRLAFGGSSHVNKLIASCWAANANDRPTFAHIVESLERHLMATDKKFAAAHAKEGEAVLDVRRTHSESVSTKSGFLSSLFKK